MALSWRGLENRRGLKKANYHIPDLNIRLDHFGGHISVLSLLPAMLLPNMYMDLCLRNTSTDTHPLFYLSTSTSQIPPFSRIQQETSHAIAVSYQLSRPLSSLSSLGRSIPLIANIQVIAAAMFVV